MMKPRHVLAALLLAACGPEAPAPEHTAPTAENGTSDGAIAYWTCPMHPSVHSPDPGRCPICGMDLTPVTKAQVGSGAVVVDEGRRNLFGVRTQPAETKQLTRTVRFAGKVDWDVRRQRDVVVRAAGTVEALRVTVGSTVRAGDSLFSLRSPELRAAEADLLATGPEGRASAATRLQALGLTRGQIDGLIARGSPLDTVPILAPAAGVVTQLDVVEGSPAAPGTAVARIADAGSVWIEANISGADAALLADGLTADVTVDAVPGHSFVGEVHPLASSAAVSRVRVDVPNAGGLLRPGLVAIVEVPVTLAPAVVVPADAVVYAGKRRVVFLDTGTDTLTPRDVEVGARVGDEITIVAGLAPGDRVVTDGNFLVAADSRLRAPAAWSGP